MKYDDDICVGTLNNMKTYISLSEIKLIADKELAERNDKLLEENKKLKKNLFENDFENFLKIYKDEYINAIVNSNPQLAFLSKNVAEELWIKQAEIFKHAFEKDVLMKKKIKTKKLEEE